MLRTPKTLLVAGLALVAVTSAVAQSTWTGAVSGNWNTSGNWDTGAVPASSADTQLTFDATTHPSMTNDVFGSFFLLNRLLFTSAAPAYSLTGTALDFRTTSGPVPLRPSIVMDTNNVVTIGQSTVLTNNLTVSGAGSGNLTFNGALSGAGSLSYSGAGTLTLGAPNNYGGGTFVNSGTLAEAGSQFARLPIGGNLTVGNGTGPAVFNANNISHGLASTAIGTLTLNTGGTFHAPGGLGGDFYLNQLNMTGGTVDLSASPNYILHFVNAGAGITSNAASSTGVWLGSNGHIENDTGSPLTITVNPSGLASGIDMDVGAALTNSGGAAAPGFVIAGAGIVRLTNPASTANITVTSGYLRVDDVTTNGVGALGTGALTLNGGTLYYAGPGPGATTAKPITLTASSSVFVASNVNLTLAGPISDSPTGSKFIVLGGVLSAVTLTGTNTFSGGVQVAGGGTLAVPTFGNGGANGPLGRASSAPANIQLGSVFDFGTLMLTGTDASYSTDRGVTVAALFTDPSLGGAIGVQNQNTTLTMSGQITGAGSFHKAGPGTLVLTNTTNSFGAAYVDGGRLTLGAATAVPAGNNVTVAAGAEFNTGGFGLADANALGTVTLNGGTLTAPAAAGMNYGLNKLIINNSGVSIDGTGSAGNAGLYLTHAGAGMAVSANTSWNGPPSFFIGNDSGAEMPLTIAPNVTVQSNISLASFDLTDPIRVTGGGTLYLRSAAFVAYFRVYHARLLFDDPAVMGNVTTTLDAATLAFSGTSATSPVYLTLASGGGAVEVTNPTTTLTLTGVIAGSDLFSLTKAGPGVLILSNTTNTFGGGIAVNGGRLDVGADNQLGAANPTVGPFGTVRYTASQSTARTFTLNSGALEAAGGVTLTLNGASVGGGFLRGTGTFAVTGGSTLAGTNSAASTTINVIGPASFSNFTNGGAFYLAAGSAAPTTLDLFTNQGSGTVTVAAGSKVNVDDFQTYGTLTLTPAVVGKSTLLTNSGPSPLFFNGGSRTFVGTPQTAGQNVALVDLHGQHAVVAGGLFVNNGFVGDSTSSGATVIADYGALVKGAGTFANSVITQNGGRFQAGNSPGIAHFGQLVLGPGGTQAFNWQINNATGTAGPSADQNNQVSGWSLLSSEKLMGIPGPGGPTTGDLIWTATTAAGTQFNMSLQTLINPTTVGNDVQGAMANFNPNQTFDWKFVQWQGNYTGPTDDATLTATVLFDKTNFTNPIDPAGRFSLHYNASGKEIDVVYSVPEPGTFALFAFAAIPLFRAKMKHRRKR